MNILCIGGAGYLGSMLIRKLLDSKYDITVLDNFLYGYNSLAGLRININNKDIRKIQEEDMEGFDVVVHLASIVGDAACDLAPSETIKINYKSTKEIAKLCFKTNQFLIYSSTCSVYGENRGICKERDSPTRPLSLYGETKLKSERAIIKSGCPYSILRLGTLFGMSYRMRFDLAINLFIAQAICREPITVFGGEQIRPFLHVQDAANVISEVIKNKWEGTFNVLWKNIKLLDIAKQICSFYNIDYSVSSDIMDKRSYIADNGKISRFGFIPKKTIKYACGEIEEAHTLGNWSNYREPIYSNHKFLFQNKELMKKVRIGETI